MDSFVFAAVLFAAAAHAGWNATIKRGLDPLVTTVLIAVGAGAMSQVYPIARGSAPLLTATVSTTWLGEPLGLVGWAGLLSLVGGVFLLSLRRKDDLARLNRRAV